jgi:hypothetical protein
MPGWTSTGRKYLEGPVIFTTKFSTTAFRNIVMRRNHPQFFKDRCTIARNFRRPQQPENADF